MNVAIPPYGGPVLKELPDAPGVPPRRGLFRLRLGEERGSIFSPVFPRQRRPLKH